MKLTRGDKHILAAALLALVVMAAILLADRVIARPLVELPPVETSGAAEMPPGESAEGTDVKKIDLNTAGLEELMTLPGIGEGRAQAILDWREENGPFRYPEDLIQVRGIGEGIYAQLEDYVTVGQQTVYGGKEDAEDLSGG